MTAFGKTHHQPEDEGCKAGKCDQQVLAPVRGNTAAEVIPSPEVPVSPDASGVGIGIGIGG